MLQLDNAVEWRIAGQVVVGGGERGVLAQLSCQEMFNNIVQIVEWQALYTLIRLLLRSNLIRIYNAFSGSSDTILSFLLICMHVVLKCRQLVHCQLCSFSFYNFLIANAVNFRSLLSKFGLHS